jgi:hypothetical protein
MCQRVANFGNGRHTRKSKQDGQSKEDDGIQSNPNSVHDSGERRLDNIKTSNVDAIAIAIVDGAAVVVAVASHRTIHHGQDSPASEA